MKNCAPRSAVQCATAAVIATVIVLVIALILRATAPSVSGFYTESATEPATRLDIAYTGTEPLGFWGSAPWGETPYAEI